MSPPAAGSGRVNRCSYKRTSTGTAWPPRPDEASPSPCVRPGIFRRGRDMGNVVVQRRAGTRTEDVVHDVTFAFVFHSFRPEGTIHTE